MKGIGIPLRPKSSILIGFSIINRPFWGPTPIFGNPHMGSSFQQFSLKIPFSLVSSHSMGGQRFEKTCATQKSPRSDPGFSVAQVTGLSRFLFGAA